MDLSPDSDESLKARIVENNDHIAALESTKLHVGAPSDGRTEGKVLGFKPQNAEFQSILDKRNAQRP